VEASQWEEIQELFHAALELPPEARADWLETRCADRPELVARVLELLASDAGESLLDRGISDLAGDVLGAVPAGRFGPYRLTRLLGEGGMGVVYEAVRDDLGSTAAIKILRDAWLSPSRRARFAAEQRVLAQLQHPSIARIYDADSLPDYGVLDDIIARYVELNQGIADIVDAGHDEAVVRDVLRRIDRSEFKRRQSAPGPKVTGRAFGKERRVPITHQSTPNHAIKHKLHRQRGEQYSKHAVNNLHAGYAE